jgi:TPP-dependent pyruvate/acetoin dehydrogenase alpha subunit
MYLIMAIGEEANIRYNIEGDDADEFFDEEDREEEKKANPLQQIKEKTISSKINQNSIPKNLLDRVKEQAPEIKNIVSEGEL